jgi:signal transduction histidine kinase
MKRDSLAHASGAGKLLMAGAVYVLVYLFAVTLLPRPSSALVRVGLGHLFLFLPAVVATVAAGRAARRARGSERGFWVLLAGASASYAAAEVLFALDHGVMAGTVGLRSAARLGYYTCMVLLTVALVVRPDRPRAQVRSAALEWVMAAVGGYFLVIYFAILPRSDARYPWFLIVIAQEALPGLWALVLALRVREPPFHRVYRWLAVGLCGGAILSVRPTWLYSQGLYQVYNPWDVAWMLPFFPIAVAAVGSRGTVWGRASGSAAGDRRRARLAVFVLAVPPLIDLACRAAGLQPELAGQRTDLTLACCSTLALLVALRVRETARPPASRSLADPADARRAYGEPSEYLQLASGVAHELNNPLMAVAGWAELSLRKGGPAPPLLSLIEATAKAAATVGRLQQLVGSEPRDPEASP